MFDVTIIDAGNDFLSLHDSIRTNTLAAGSAWTRHFMDLGNPTIDVVIDLDNHPLIPTANGASVANENVAIRNGFNISQQGAAAEILTGLDPNGADPDVRFNFGSLYLTNELWFDPDPIAQSAAVPTDKTDAFSVLLHEFGHAFGFNGFMDGTDGTFPLGNFKSTFDELVTFVGTDFSFVGPNAMDLYGGPLPITFGNPFHLGNAVDPGRDLIPDLMNGVVFDRGVRYDISLLDLAIFSDIGLPVGVQVAQIPEPSTLALFVVGLAGLGIVTRRRPARRRIPGPALQP